VAPELQAALTGLLAACTAFVYAEIRYRQAMRSQGRADRRLEDVQRKIGADRRSGDRGLEPDE
jgi:hypothetical protein